MKKLISMLAVLGVGALAQSSFAQTAAPQNSKAVSSYSAPTAEHQKKPKSVKMHRAAKKAAPAAGASE